jgi:hypothetical protein
MLSTWTIPDLYLARGPVFVITRWFSYWRRGSCWSMAAGKSRPARALAARNHAALLLQDDFLEAL